jgi:Helix-turn-helix domain
MSSEEEKPGRRAAASGGSDGPAAAAEERATRASQVGQATRASQVGQATRASQVGQATPASQATAAPGRRRAGQKRVDDPALMRALAHPLRWALLEALTHAGTLTATQAGDILGETPANCAFHLRTLARYGLVEEAGGGKGRERPWRRAVSGLTMEVSQDDPKTAAAAGVLHDFWLNATLDRARSALLSQASWPVEWRNVLASNQSLRYVTVSEAEELQAELMAVLDRFVERNDDPAVRPADALPIEYLLLGYPLMDLVGRPVPGSGSDGSTADSADSTDSTSA